jgi:hypothetical protein
MIFKRLIIFIRHSNVFFILFLISEIAVDVVFLKLHRSNIIYLNPIIFYFIPITEFILYKYFKVNVQELFCSFYFEVYFRDAQ